MIGKICGTGSYIPPKILSNDDLSEMVETSDESIRERTGVRNRHIAGEETSYFMASEAAKRAVENAGISPEEIDLILVASSSPDVIFPSVACEVQKAIGAVHASGYDMQAACTGFVFAYQTAQAYIKAGFYKTILLIGSEALSTMVDWTDRGTCILFGDGAGAAILCAAEERRIFRRRIWMVEKGRHLFVEAGFRTVSWRNTKIPGRFLEIPISVWTGGAYLSLR